MDAIRKELGEDDDGDAAADYRGPHRRPRGRRGGRRGRPGPPQGARALRAHARTEHGAGLDRELARHGPRPALDRAHRGSARRDRGPRDPRRRPHGPRRGQGADRRAPGRAQASGRARRGRGGHRPPAAGRHHRPGRASRRRQDLPRRVRGPRPRAALRAGRPGRRAGRGRDPRPPAHLRRRPAGPAGQGHHRGGDHEPRRPPRRGRQAGQRLPGRPLRRPARGARPRPEPHVPGPLPRGRPGPVRRAVHRHRQRRSRPCPARCSTASRSSGSTATPRTRRSPSPGTTCSPARSGTTGSRDGEVEVTDDAPCTGPSPATPEKPGCASSSASWARPSARSAMRVADGTATPVVVDERRPDRPVGPGPLPRRGPGRPGVGAGGGHRSGRDRCRRRCAAASRRRPWTARPGSR